MYFKITETYYEVTTQFLKDQDSLCLLSVMGLFHCYTLHSKTSPNNHLFHDRGILEKIFIFPYQCITQFPYQSISQFSWSYFSLVNHYMIFLKTPRVRHPFRILHPQPLRAVWVLFSPMMSRWMVGGWREKSCPLLSQKLWSIGCWYLVGTSIGGFDVFWCQVSSSYMSSTDLQTLANVNSLRNLTVLWKGLLCHHM